tara:strand:+ start:451 stop:789 length:339 start_codon:yes stop_codon:yes gene_type:complete
MAFQRVTPTRLAQAASTTAFLAIYTCPSNTRAYVKDITVCNTTGDAVTLFVSLVPDQGTAGTANALFSASSIAANTTFQWKGTQILSESETIQFKGSATGLTIHVSGGEAIE